MRLLHGDTCGSSSGAGALRPPGSRSGRSRARRPDGRRTLLNTSAVSHDSPTEPPLDGTPGPGRYALWRPLYSTSGGSDMALILIFSFSLQALFPPLGDPRRERPLQHNSESGEVTECNQKLKVMCSRGMVSVCVVGGFASRDRGGGTGGTVCTHSTC